MKINGSTRPCLADWPGKDRREPPFSAACYLQQSALAKTIREAIGNALQGKCNLRVLDLGCGKKPYYPYLAPVCQSYIGVDVRHTIVGPDCFAVGENLPFRADSFDVVLCTQVLPYVNQPWRVVDEVGRVLRTQGVLILSAPGVLPYQEDYWRFTHQGLIRILNFYGLQVARVLPNGGVFRCFFSLFAFFIGALSGGQRLVKPLKSVAIVVNNMIGLLLEWLAGGKGEWWCSAGYTLVATKTHPHTPDIAREPVDQL